MRTHCPVRPSIANFAGLSLLLFLVGVLAACSTGDVADDVTPSTQSNAETAAKTPQPSQPQQQIVASPFGEQLFSNNCSLCHGADLRGTNTGPSLLHEYYEPNHHSNASFVIAVRRGVRQHHWDFGNMPAVEGLSIEEVHAVICYIREAQLEDGLIEEIPTSIDC